MKVTAQWIAEQCGVSRGTVDRVVNGRPNVAPEVRERVQKIISEYGYKTPSQRQAARAGHGAFRIGVILPSWDAFFIRRMREGIRVAVHNRGLNDVNVLVEELKNRSHRAYFEAIGRMEERGIDGLIVTAPDTVAMSEEIDRLVAIGIPVVTCDSDVRQSRRLYHIGQKKHLIRAHPIIVGLRERFHSLPAGIGGQKHIQIVWRRFRGRFRFLFRLLLFSAFTLYGGVRRPLLRLC